MKKLLIGLLIMGATFSCFAKIPDGCKSNLENIVSDHNAFESRVPSSLDRGELTISEVDFMRDMHSNVAQTVALLCAGLRKIELQKTLFAKAGFISQKKAQREADEAYSEAMDFYFSKTMRD